MPSRILVILLLFVVVTCISAAEKWQFAEGLEKSGWVVAAGKATIAPDGHGDRGMLLEGQGAAMTRNVTLAPSVYEFTVWARGSGSISLEAVGAATPRISRSARLYDSFGLYGLLFVVHGNAEQTGTLTLRVNGPSAVVDYAAVTPATREQQQLWAEAERSYTQFGYYGTNPHRPAPTPNGTAQTKILTTAELEQLAIRERVVFYDENYDAHWVENPAEVAAFFVRRGFTQLDVPGITAWMREKVVQHAANGTSATFVMGVVPTSLLSEPLPDCLLAQYLRAGGRIVWAADIPLYNSQDETGSITAPGDRPREVLFGMTSDRQTYYGAPGPPQLTDAAKAWGLEPGMGLIRPVHLRSVTVPFVIDPTGNYCGVGMVNLCPENPLSGFITVPDQLQANNEPLLRNLYRLASFSGTPVIIPAPSPLPAETDVAHAVIWFGPENRRTVYLRSETLPLLLHVDAREALCAVTAHVRVLEGAKLLHAWTPTVRVTRGVHALSLATLPLAELRRGIYTVVVKATLGDKTVTLEREFRVAAPPDHEGLHVALWVSVSSTPRRAEYTMNWLANMKLQPMFVDTERDYARDLALWHGMSYSLRLHGQSEQVQHPAGYDMMRRNAGGEVMAIAAQGNKREAKGYASPLRRAAEVEDFGRYIADEMRFPAFRKVAVTGDDYSQWFGADYNRYAVEGFRQKYGMAMPRPAQMLHADSTVNIPRAPGILPDNDPWLLANRYWSEDVLGRMGTQFSQVMRRVAGDNARVGPIPGAMQIPVINMWSAMYPYYNFGARHGFNLSCFYYYNTYWQPFLAHHWWLECARIGNRDGTLWMMPDSYIGGNEQAGNDRAYFRHIVWQMLSGGATGMEYFQSEQRVPAADDAMRFLGGLSERYGRLLGAIHPAPKTIGLLVPFEQVTYHLESGFELAYPYMELLQAQADIEPVSPEELTPQSIHRYKALILAHTNWLREGTVTLLADYIAAGGKVLLDASTAPEIDIPGATRLPIAIGGTWYDAYGNSERIAATRRTPSGISDQ